MPRELHEFGPSDTECQFSGRNVPGAGNTERQRQVSGLGGIPLVSNNSHHQPTAHTSHLLSCAPPPAHTF